MSEVNNKFLSSKYNKCFIGLLIIGFGFILTGLLFLQNLPNQLIEFLIPILITLGLSIIGVSFAIYSIGLSKTSDERMKAIADDSFLALIGIFEDYRLTLKTKRTQLDKLKRNGKDKSTAYEILYTEYFDILSFSIWKSYTYLQRAIVLLKGVPDEEYEKKLVHYTTEYFAELILGRDFTEMYITEEYKDHLREMYKFVSSLGVYNDHKNKTKMEEYRIKLNL